MNVVTTAHRARRKADVSNADDDILTRTFSVVERLSAEYPAHALADIRTLRRLADRMTAEGDRRAVHYDEICRIAHDIRGQGTLFGYPLVTRCATSLCIAVRRLEPDADAVTGLVRTHAAALQAILRGPPDYARSPSALFVAEGLELLVLLQIRRAGHSHGIYL